MIKEKQEPRMNTNEHESRKGNIRVYSCTFVVTKTSVVNDRGAVC